MNLIGTITDLFALIQELVQSVVLFIAAITGVLTDFGL